MQLSLVGLFSWQQITHPTRRRGGVLMVRRQRFLLALERQVSVEAQRFAVEFLRLKDDRFLAGFTVAQLISLVVLLFLGFLAWRRSAATAVE